MAYSPFEKSNNSLNRSRSSSCSSPKTNRIFYQEVYSDGKDTLVRSFSCDQFYNKDDTGQTYQAVKYHISNFITPTKKFKKSIEGNKSWSVPKRLASDYPNDKSQSSKARLSLKYPDDKESNKNFTTKEGSSRTSKMGFFIIGAKYVIVPLLAWCATNLVLNQKQCYYTWDLTQLNNKLHDSVFGQEESSVKLVNLLDKFNRDEDPMVLLFTGGTGVGKTYTASIINHQLPWSMSEHLSFTNPINYMGENDFRDKFSSCGGNLVIIDDISILDSTRAIMFSKKILSSFNGQKLMVILIFRIQNSEQENLVLTQLKSSKIEFHHVPFRKLTKDDVRQCFNKEIKRLQINVPEEALSKLVEEQMSYVDVLKGSPGCKGISDLLKYF